MARTTLADVAREAGVSVALVSIVMRDAPGASDATRARVRDVADRLGYVPDQRARLLRSADTRLLGVTFDLHQPFHGDLVEHLYAAAADQGYDVAISAVAPSRDERSAVQALRRERCDALVLLGPDLSPDDLAALGADLPTLVVARRSGTAGVGVKVCHMGCSNMPECNGTNRSVSPRLGIRMQAFLSPPIWEVQFGDRDLSCADELRS